MPKSPLQRLAQLLALSSGLLVLLQSEPAAAQEMSTLCHFNSGPRVGQTQDYAPLAPIAVGSPCQDGQGSNGVVISRPMTSMALAEINGVWNAADHSGNAAIDGVLDKFARASSGNPAAMNALEQAAADVKGSPEAFVNANGSLRQAPLAALLSRRFAGVAGIDVPTLLSQRATPPR